MKHMPGVTLLELVVASALMGILFFSGLQLLTTFFSTQAKLAQDKAAISTSGMKLEAQLRLLLQDAQKLEIAEKGRSLYFSKGEERQRLRFHRVAGTADWQLLFEEKPLASWKPPDTREGFRFEESENQLLRVQLARSSDILLVWLRNKP